MYPASSYCLHYFIQHFIAIFIHFCAVNKFKQSINQTVHAHTNARAHNAMYSSIVIY